MRKLVVLLLVLVASAPSQAQELFPDAFEWPAPESPAIDDIRVGDAIAQANRTAREAAGDARAAESLAKIAKRLLSARIAIGRGPSPTRIADGAVMVATPYDEDTRTLYGTINWADGASLTGLITDSVGVYTPSPESVLSSFRGVVDGVQSPRPQPMYGVFEFRNGERFTGAFLGGTNSEGIYESADRSKKFVGTLDLVTGSPRPIQGQVRDSKGHLLAIVRRQEY